VVLVLPLADASNRIEQGSIIGLISARWKPVHANHLWEERRWRIMVLHEL
jgi:hypothetical protein